MLIHHNRPQDAATPSSEAVTTPTDGRSQSPMNSRLVVIIGAVAAGCLVLLVVVGGVALGLLTTEPAHQLDLPGTAWTIRSIGDDSTTARAYTLAFDADGNNASIALSCGTVHLGWSWDTDGSALNFAAQDPAPSSCQSPSGPDRAVLDAVVSTKAWRVESDSRIHLDSTPPLVLDHAPDG